MTNKVLLTGGSGFIGSHVLNYLLEKTDWEFVCLASWRHRGSPLRLQKAMQNSRVKIITHDLRGTMPDLGRFDYILHLASESHVDRSISDPVPFVENNVQIMLQVLEYARRYPPLSLINFGCYDSETRAVTDRGFKKYNELKIGDRVLTLNKTTKSAEWHPIKKVHIFPYTGDMYWFKSYRTDILVTPDHRMLVEEENGEWAWRDAKSQSTKDFSYLPSATSSPGIIKNILEVPGIGDLPIEDVLFLLGVYIGDGHSSTGVKKIPSKSGYTRKELNTHRNSKGQFVSGITGGKNTTVSCHSHRTFFEVPEGDKCRIRLIETLTRLGISHSAYRKNIYVGGKEWVDYFRNQCGAGAHNKRIPSWIFDLDASLLSYLLDGLMLTDGHYRKDSITWAYTSVSESLIGEVAALGVQLGWRANIQERKETDTEKPPIINGREIIGGVSYDVVLTKTRLPKITKKHTSTIPYSGDIWCITVPNRNFLIERNGKLAFCGNTDEVVGSAHVGATTEEWSTILPSNPYAASKAAAESLCIAWWKTYNVPVILTNTNNILGSGQDEEKFVPKIIRKVLAGEEVQIHAQHGEIGSRFWNPVDNVSDALLYILMNATPPKSRDESDRPDRYNLSGGEELDNLQLAKRIADLCGKTLNAKIVDVGDIRPGYDKHYAATVGKLAELGWKPPVSFEEGLTQTIKEELGILRA